MALSSNKTGIKRTIRINFCGFLTIFQRFSGSGEDDVGSQKRENFSPNMPERSQVYGQNGMT